MQILKRFLISNDKDKLKTEIVYNIASAKADEAELLILSFQCTPDKITIDYTERTIKQLKNTLVDFFIRSCEVGNSTVGSYILNKFPHISKYIESDETAFIIKLQI